MDSERITYQHIVKSLGTLLIYAEMLITHKFNNNGLYEISKSIIRDIEFLLPISSLVKNKPLRESISELADNFIFLSGLLPRIYEENDFHEIKISDEIKKILVSYGNLLDQFERFPQNETVDLKIDLKELRERANSLERLVNNEINSLISSLPRRMKLYYQFVFLEKRILDFIRKK